MRLIYGGKRKTDKLDAENLARLARLDPKLLCPIEHRDETTQQQVARYERDGWQKISLWRLAEAADALGLDLSIRARLPASNTARAAGVG